MWIDQVAYTQTSIKKYNEANYREKRTFKKDYLSYQILENVIPLDDASLRLIDSELLSRMQLSKLTVLIHLKKTDEALAIIKEFSSKFPATSLSLCNQLLVAWSSSANPNAIVEIQEQNPRQQKAIPLTRMRQIENLKTLHNIYKKIKELHIGDVSDKSLIYAFASCHSKAEVYQLKDILSIFGPIEQISDSRLSALVRDIQMRLRQAWTDETMQKSFRTGRSKKEIKESLDRGYNLIIKLLSDRLQKRDDYKLRMLLANTYSSWAYYEKEQAEKNNKFYELSNFSKKINLAFKNYEKAVVLYQNDLAQSKVKQLDISPFINWFDLLLKCYESPTSTGVANMESWGFVKLRKLILATPQPKQHMKLFGETTLKTLTSQSKDKKATIDAALIVLQDDPSARVAKEFQAYYNELVQEIQLNAQLTKGSITSVNGDIGVMVSLYHTDQISRECHGFTQFISVSSSGNKPIDYRSAFTKNIRTALEKSFKIKSIAYVDPSTRPRPLIINGVEKAGWSETPLAFIHLEKIAPSVDKIPSFALDIPFFDYDGQVTIPFPSNEILLASNPVASPGKAGDKTSKSTAENKSAGVSLPRNLKIFQTLNTHTRDKNIVNLEIRATANDMIPPLHDILDVHFKNFKVVNETDEGVQVNKLVNTDSETYPETERNWTISLSLPDLSPNKPTKFHFPTPTDASVPVEYHQYQDADLVSVGPVVDFNAKTMESKHAWVWWLLLIPVVGLIVWFVYYKKKSNAAVVETEQCYRVPQSLNPFTCAALLMTIRHDHVIKDDKLIEELNSDIKSIEQSQFAQLSAQGSKKQKKSSSSVDFSQLAETWVKRANRSR